MNFRIPYMDWAAQPPTGESVLPTSVGGSPYVNASGPNGIQQIANPLYTYLFKPLNATMFIEAPVCTNQNMVFFYNICCTTFHGRLTNSTAVSTTCG